MVAVPRQETPLAGRWNLPPLEERVIAGPVQLLEDIQWVRLELVEGKDGGKLIMRGEFARAGVPTENKRLYTTPLWERELLRLDQALTERRVFGEMDHPTDGRTQLHRISHIVTGLRMTPDGVIIGEAEIINTQRGRDLRAILESGARVGVSSRGYGSTITNEKGQDVVQEDYRLVTFDFVAEPANVTSYPSMHREAKEEIMAAESKKTEPAKTAAPNPPGAVEGTEAMKGELADVALEVFAKERDKIREEERASLLADPGVAGSKAALDQILGVLREHILPKDAEEVVKEKDETIAKLKNEVAERDLKITGLEEEVDKVASVAREVGYKFFLENQISGLKDAKILRSMVGEVTQYENPDAIKARLEEAKQEVADRQAKQQALDERRQKELDLVEEDKKNVNVRLSKTEAALEKAVELNQALSLEIYTSSRVATHPKAAELRDMFEHISVTSKAEVDRLIDDYKQVPVRDPETLEQIRARVRTVTQGGLNTTPLEEERGPEGPGNNDNYNGLGVSLAELRARAELTN